MAERSLLATLTGEHFQPVRLHYKIRNRAKLLQAFQKLRCIDDDAPRKRRVWLYAHEARKLKFRQSYDQIPQDAHPIVIGAFFLRPEDRLLLDLRSCERALQAIPFFDAHLPRRLVALEDAEIVNRLFPATESNLKLTPDVLFDAQTIAPADPESLVRQLLQKAADAGDLAEKPAIVQKDLESRSKEPLPDVERFPVHDHEDGIGGFQLALRLRQIVALQHWHGRADYTVHDAIQSLIKAS